MNDPTGPLAISGPLRRIAPAALAVLIVALWQGLVTGLNVPRILLPAPSDIAAALVHQSFELDQDWRQTILRGALPGYVFGNLIGLLAALAIDRSVFLQRGVLPLSSLFSAMPIIGVAPIMVMWFGFDWQSKAAVVTLMTLFPMLAHAGAGLGAASPIELDLLRSYGAGYGQTLWRLRLPAMLPHLFAALKLNAPTAVIGAMIAEFFGTPTFGLGFRISAEVGRLGFDIVWAAILVAMLSASALYGLVALAERRLTFWHPSLRR
jgi:NitT/TauT family transport system permease protein